MLKAKGISLREKGSGGVIHLVHALREQELPKPLRKISSILNATVFPTPVQLAKIIQLYGLEKAKKNGLLRLHYSPRSVRNHFSKGDSVLLTFAGEQWYDELAHLTEPFLASKNPYDFHLSLMEIAEVEDKKFLLNQAVRHNLYGRKHFAYSLMVVAEEARRMGLDRLSVIEFGVWKGNGLKNLASLASLVHDCTGVAFDVYGFDTSQGMPPAVDWRDHPELWQAGQMKMPDYEALQKTLPDHCTLVIGPIEETIESFCANRMSPDSPLAFISFDMDYYSSTMQSLRVMENPPDHYLPVMPIWVDDSYIHFMQSRYAGEALALRDFNGTHELRKFEYKQIRPNDHPEFWHNCVWFCHIFDHPMRSGSVPAGNFNRFFINLF
jgi:hypothetical protein